jgi:hypothetical protein
VLPQPRLEQKNEGEQDQERTQEWTQQPAHLHNLIGGACEYKGPEGTARNVNPSGTREIHDPAWR